MNSKGRGVSTIAGRAHTTVADDANVLAALGHKQELKRNFSMISMLGLAFAIMNSWTALSASLNLALPSGGPSAAVWGLITAGTCNLCLAASMAEFLSAYPTAGGQYHWAAIISWKSWSPIISWATGWISVSGWIALTATGGLLESQMIMGAISLYNPSFEPQRWQQFLIYIAFALLIFMINAFFNRLLPLITQAALWWSLSGFIIVSITVLACASPNYQSAAFVYGNFINETGWSDGLAWLLGMLQGGLAITAFDACAHMIEEIPEPHLTGPKIVVLCIIIGMVTGWGFVSVLLFVLTDIDSVNSSAAGPLLEILYQATKNAAGAVCLLIFPLVCMFFGVIGAMSASSRIIWAFARDQGLPFSGTLAKVHPKLGNPLNALIMTTGVVVVFGFIFLGSTSAFNALVAASVVALGISYAIPPAINMLRGRKMLPENRAFKLPEWLGWTCNMVGVLYTILSTVLFVFPPYYPVTGSNMNYCIVAFAIILAISTIQWIIDGRKNYTGPQMAIEGAEPKEEVARQSEYTLQETRVSKK